MQNLKEYLIKAREFNSPKIRALVFGNSSADMDSVVSSFITSYFYGSIKKHKNYLYSPVINCAREDLVLRIEIIEHLKNCGIDKDFLNANVYFQDDLIQSNAQIESVVLVDFNKLNKEFEELSDRVHFIIDHHIDNNLYSSSLIEK